MKLKIKTQLMYEMKFGEPEVLNYQLTGWPPQEMRGVMTFPDPDSTHSFVVDGVLCAAADGTLTVRRATITIWQEKVE